MVKNKNKNNIKIKSVKMNKIYYEALKDFKELRTRRDFYTSYELYRIRHHLESCINKSNIYGLTHKEFRYIFRLVQAYKGRFRKITDKIHRVFCNDIIEKEERKNG